METNLAGLKAIAEEYKKSNHSTLIKKQIAINAWTHYIPLITASKVDKNYKGELVSIYNFTHKKSIKNLKI